MSAPYLDMGSVPPKLVVTDGHAMVALPVEVEPGDVSGYRDPKTLEPIASRGMFPEWSKKFDYVCDNRPPPKYRVSIALDPERLLRVAQAAGVKVVKLEFRTDDPFAPIIVSDADSLRDSTEQDVIALQMSIRT